MARPRAVFVPAVAALLSAAVPALAQDIPDPAAGPEALVRLSESASVAGLLERLKMAAPSREILFTNVRLVDPVAGRASGPASVLVRDGRILSVGPKIAKPRRAFVVDGRGRFLAPGLVDSHFHTNSTAAPLLNLAYGVTSVREMDGFPWMLHWRANVHSRRMLAPYPYVAGQIINAFDMGGYAIVPKSIQDARSIVRGQAACGFEAIKVHNAVPLPAFDAIAAEAKAVGLPLVGHVPHDIPVRHAAEAGMRTMEHLKGWLNDRTLEIGDRDYEVARDFPQLWVTPTLYATQDSLHGAEAAAFLRSPEASLISASRRARWQDQVNAPADRLSMLRDAQRAKMLSIVKELHKRGARFLAGTDADGYPFTVAGFGLTAEMRLMMSAGLTAPEVLRAATSEPAVAFGHPAEFGRIKPGMRADLVLLPRNPLADPLIYRENQGVMANGRWLSRAALDSALANLRRLFKTPVEPMAARALSNYVTDRASGGYVFDAASLANAATALRKARAPGPAARIVALAEAESRCPAKS